MCSSFRMLFRNPFPFFSSSEPRELSVPKTVTCRVLSTDTLKALSNSLIEKDHAGNQHMGNRSSVSQPSRFAEDIPHSRSCSDSTLVIAGLHACGDLSVTMLRWVPYCILCSFLSLMRWC